MSNHETNEEPPPKEPDGFGTKELVWETQKNPNGSDFVFGDPFVYGFEGNPKGKPKPFWGSKSLFFEKKRQFNGLQLIPGIRVQQLVLEAVLRDLRFEGSGREPP